LLSLAIPAGASPQLRNMASSGATPAATRCSTFTTSHPLQQARAGHGARREGHKPHARRYPARARLGRDTPSDWDVALVRLKRKCVWPGLPASARSHSPISSAYGETRRSSHTTLHPDEIVTAIELPSQVIAKNDTYLKIRPRPSVRPCACSRGLSWTAGV